uniref:Uncharacterized protein n=1 Tax=Strombidium rassoulzadegani TaxID=1082188 RepID=A0A7S3FV02_9SPIT|mmetsp:Transcript_14438/g.24633  ORF Transcript_14438/g.24633 Transcript_14438/m.24633 type:complete len:138 (+) Transcript_14438:29-442(+)
MESELKPVFYNPEAFSDAELASVKRHILAQKYYPVALLGIGGLSLAKMLLPTNVYLRQVKQGPLGGAFLAVFALGQLFVNRPVSYSPESKIFTNGDFVRSLDINHASYMQSSFTYGQQSLTVQQYQRDKLPENQKPY